MKKQVFILLLACFATVSHAQTSIYDYIVKNIDEENFDFSQLKGKKILIVNTASKCGYTPQYAQLQKIYEQYKDQNFIIIGFPANNFMNQEPGTAKEIAEFCILNYGVTFPMMAKISVKGTDMAPIYQWLTQKALNGVMDSEVSWNFQKYLINEKGQLVAMVPTREQPDSERIVNWIRTGIFVQK